MGRVFTFAFSTLPCLFCVVLSGTLHAQLVKVWEVNTLINDYGYAAKVNPDGYVYGYYTEYTTANNNDIHVWKIDGDGTTVFNQTWHDANDMCGYVSCDELGNIYAQGRVWNDIENSYLILKYDAGGTLVWENLLTMPDGYTYEYVENYAANQFGDLLAFGYLSNNVLCDEGGCNSLYGLAHYNQSVDPVWQYIRDDCPTHSGEPAIYSNNIVLTSDQSAIVSYTSYENDQCYDASCDPIDSCTFHFDFRLMKINSNGSVAWDTEVSTPHNRIILDKDENLIRLSRDGSNPADMNLNYIEKFSSSGTRSWITSVDYSPSTVIADGDNNLIVFGIWYGDDGKKDNAESMVNTYHIAKYSGTTGSEMWRQTTDIYGTFAIGANNSIYVGGRLPIGWPNQENYIQCYSTNGIQQFNEFLGTGTDIPSVIIGIDNDNCVYAKNYYNSKIAKYLTAKPVTIQNANGDPISSANFDLVKITNDPPLFSETALGKVTTDSDGIIEFMPVSVTQVEVQTDGGTVTLDNTDTIKIAKHVYSQDAVKHPVTLPTMYSVHLDNAKFAANGSMSFDIVSELTDEIVLNHTELRYNLLVCLEWDASVEYLRGLDSNLRAMSNYIYDVSDGQIRFDTILVYDDMEAWLHADMRIEADNVEWPHCEAGVGGINHPWSAGRNIVMPRRWYGNVDACRNLSASIHPINLVHSNDYRTKVHEFGHYGLGFYDEYMFWNPDSNKYTATDALRCNPPHLYNYGFMDRQYANYGENSSEMSSGYGYVLGSCRNTKQYGILHMSCWDHLERWVEATTWGADNIFVPILKPDGSNPDERQDLTGEIFIGPNNDLAHPDYDVGKLLVLPRAPQLPAAGIGEVLVTVNHSSGGDKADVLLVNNPSDPSPRMIRQGTTSDAGRLWVVGANAADCDIEAWKNGSQGTVTGRSLSSLQSTGVWLFGGATLGSSGVSRYGNRYWTSLSEDSLTIELNEVVGDYPLVFDLDAGLAASTFRIMTVNPFTTAPSVDLSTDAGVSQSYVSTSVASGYESLISDSLGGSGELRLWAVDDTGASFFVPIDYEVTERDSSVSYFEFNGPRWMSSVWIDSVNTAVELGLVLTSPYPVPNAGLGPEAVQAGQTHSVALYPDDPLSGTNQISIRYEDADLLVEGGMTGDESTLEVYRWNEGAGQWEVLGGTVNTELNSVESTIPGEGVYAAFTSQIITGIGETDPGSSLPYRFELSQNYPNPFNPVTMIEYALPTRSHVTITVYNILGQPVTVLVDGERPSGSHVVEWDGTDRTGAKVASGLYLYRFQAGDHVQSKKMMLVK